MRTPANFFRSAAVAAISAALVATAVPAAPAFAEDTDLEALQNAAIQASADYEEAQQELDSLQQQIDENEASIAEIEQKLPELKEHAAAAITTSYKLHQDQNSLLALLLSADTFNEFITQLSYLNHIVGNATNDMNDLVEAENELNAKQAELEQQKSDEEARVEAARQASEEADAAVEAAKQKAMENAAAQQAAYEAQQAAGQQDATVAEIEEATSSSDAAADASSSQSQDAGSRQSSSAGSESSSSADAGSSSSSGSGSSATESVSYTYVQASTYGEGDGLMYGTTASGDTVTPTSMGVAMKTMPLGTIIEISYNGRTVTAVVNDRGPYSGNRQIDMQPAVAHALGFSGVGTVGYRVVS